MPHLLPSPTPDTRPLHAVRKAELDGFLAGRTADERAWLLAQRFKAEANQVALLPGRDGRPDGAVLGLGEWAEFWAFGALPGGLPDGSYRLAGALPPAQASRAALAFLLGHYQFGRYRKTEAKAVALVEPEGVDRGYVRRAAWAIGHARDLINTAAEDLGPAELAAAVRELGARHGASTRLVVGDELLRANYPAIHAVGRAAARPPCLADLTWGDPAQPKLTLIGKGVCFDSGGLDLKPAAAMLRMKKDMGGAATLIGLAAMVMDRGLPVRLRLMVPAVENAVAGNAFRPGDVIRTRKGLTVEVGNTDAEGRIILCDPLAEADAEQPALLVDVATLTGAARTALGPDLPALFTPDDGLAEALLAHGREELDPLWRLPLHERYRDLLKSRVADLNNVSDGPFAGAITAALYLKSFVEATTAYAHIDSYAWIDDNRPGRPAGGEPLALRALYALVEQRFGRSRP
ncbi:MAG: leucyl aminopeptidase family protein [Alphaproteobacteria bacterium]|nr:leucyl aminopeptidase family protein [Alphaproteobacteria bacterium]